MDMNIRSLIAQHVLEVHEGGNWTDVNITDTIRDITVKEAVMHTQASPNTIASILHHLTYWNRVMVQRIGGVRVAIPDRNGFDTPQLDTEQDWQQLKADNLASAHELATAINSFDENRLMEPILEGYSSGYKNMQGTVEHIHYHLGQLVILKHLVRAMSQ
jgi:DinB superfamily